MTLDEGRQQARRRSYPYLPTSNWRELRRRFNTNPPRGEVDAAYLAGVLGITDRAAANIVPSLRDLGLIDNANRATELAMAWRDDEQYPAVVEQMLDAVYPQALRDVAPPPNPDREVAKRWFMRDLNTGEPGAERLARFYAMLASGNPNPPEDLAGDRNTGRRAAAARGRATRAAAPTARARGRVATEGATAGRPPATAAPATTAVTRGPEVHIDIQVHIDPAAPAEQIDAIFASMARHLYGRD
jgi:hypothetical protein